ncbi:flagellar hook-associated protein FlgK [Pelosinus sp. sgz500959]|uniref:flagellar hook-associated protein FlgK n=1 Tax=Pelosinus sp. sgz500959 TaxID=3242472 RepID=UPI003671B75F
MSSAFSGLNTMVRGLSAQQASLETVGHNIANANTAGYSRQNVNLVTTNPQTLYGGNGNFQLGTGVNIASVTRARDSFVDKQMWKESSTLGYGQTMQNSLTKVEGVFQEPSDTGVQTVLNQFWTSLQTLSTNASDNGTRTTVQQRGVELVNAIKHANQQLKDMITDINTSINLKVSSINQITSEIGGLNHQIVTVEAGGTDHANDLRDRRDLLVDQLSTMMNITVTEDKAGNYQIQSSGGTLVDASGSQKLDTVKSKDSYYGYSVENVVVAGSGQVINFSSGEMKGLIDSRDSSQGGVREYLDKLDKVSQFLLQDFNDVHKAGYGLNDTVGGTNFFGVDGTKYENWSPQDGEGGWVTELQVNSTILDPSTGLAKIAAKTLSTQGNASGDNAVKLGIRLKTDISSTLGNSSLDNYYSSLITGLGVQSQDAKRITENQTTLVAQITNWRESTAGVNMDEELTNMIKFQKGYNSAARVLTTMDEMLDKLINSTGTVGR